MCLSIWYYYLQIIQLSVPAYCYIMLGGIMASSKEFLLLKQFSMRWSEWPKIVRSPCMMKHSFVTVTSKWIISSLSHLQAMRFQEYGHTWKSLGCLSHCDWKQKINERFLFVISRLSTWHEIENSCHKTEYFHNIILFKDLSWQVISILDNCNDNTMYTIRVYLLNLQYW